MEHQGAARPYGRHGVPNTHRFAQARTVFAVARARCREVYALQDAVTLWDLPAEIEDAFEERWQHWIHDAAALSGLFQSIEALAKAAPIPDTLVRLAGVSASTLERTSALRRGPDGRSVPISGIGTMDDTAIGVLACAFARGEAGQLAVPVAKRGAA